MEEMLFLAVLFVSNVIQAITGFAGTVLAMPASAMLIGLTNAKVVLNALAIISGLTIAMTSWKDIRWRELLKIISVMLVGMFIGSAIFKLVPSEQLLLQIYGVIIVGIALKNIIFRKEVTLTPSAQYAILLAAGVVHGMFVSGGALLVIYAVAVLGEKRYFRATLAGVWVVLDTTIAITQVQAHQFTPQNIHYILISILPLFVATYIGTKIAKVMKQSVFLNITYVLLIVSGVSLLL